MNFPNGKAVPTLLADISITIPVENELFLKKNRYTRDLNKPLFQ